MGKLPTAAMGLGPSRAALLPSSSRPSYQSVPCASRQQVRHATLIPRPRRPYTFTQLVQLSDGSAYTVRTTSPQPLYRSTKDTRNTLLWQPSEKSLKNVELDEAGRLAAFRERFGRAFDAAQQDGGAAVDGEGEAGAAADDSYADLITEYVPENNAAQLRSQSDKFAARAAAKKK